MKLKWESESITKFRDDIGTVYTRGPFDIDGIEYDYKLEDKDGEDYCSAAQMKTWGVEMAEDMSN